MALRTFQKTISLQKDSESNTMSTLIDVNGKGILHDLSIFIINYESADKLMLNIDGEIFLGNKESAYNSGGTQNIRNMRHENLLTQLTGAYTPSVKIDQPKEYVIGTDKIEPINGTRGIVYFVDFRYLQFDHTDDYLMDFKATGVLNAAFQEGFQITFENGAIQEDLDDRDMSIVIKYSMEV